MESSSPRVKFNRSFPIWWRNLMQWGPFIPKGGGMIQVDNGGHPLVPPIYNGSTSWHVFYGFLGSKLSRPFWVPKRHLFGAKMPRMLWKAHARMNRMCIPRREIFDGVPSTPNRGWMKIPPPMMLMYQLTTSGPTNLLVFHLLGSWFWMFRIFSLMLHVKRKFHPLYN
jgi:hypothetical protein